MQCRSIAILAVPLCFSVPVSASEEINRIPCPSFVVGNEWNYSLSSPLFQTTIEYTIISNENNVITLGDKYRVSASGMPEMQHSQISILRKLDKNYVLTEIHQEQLGGDLKLERPYCGNLEEKYNYKYASNIGGIRTEGEKNMKVEFLGIEQVQVAAGEFMASVFEISVTETVPSLAPGQIENEWMTIYMVEKVGMVKMVNVMESLAPVRVGGSAQSDEINALMQEGISAMQRGEDPADLFKRMTELQSSAGVGGLEYQSRKNTIIQELVKYTVD